MEGGFSMAFLIDGHADILYRMEEENLSFFDHSSKLHSSYDSLQRGGVRLQFFALFTESKLSPEQSLTKILAYIDTFYRVIAGNCVQPILSASDLAAAQSHEQLENQPLTISGILSIEGAQCLQCEIRILHVLYQLGVRAIGLTWNHSNCIADGLGEPRGAGLTQFGKEVIDTMNQLGMLIDVSHLSVRGFWDVAERSKKPFIASHSNCTAIHIHRRNLSDDQIRAIIECNGTIGMTFVPYFITDGPATIDDLIRHIDHVLELGGQKHIAFGSDFDGITETMIDLRSASDYPKLLEEIERRYGQEVLLDISCRNLTRVLKNVLIKG